jgi:hypothetical protein
MHKNAMKSNETLSKWCKNKHGSLKIMDTLETYQVIVTSEAEASNTKAELQCLKEQATKWEVDIARLNADLASKLSNSLTFILPDISCPTYPVLHTINFSGITIMPTYTHFSNIFFAFQPSSLDLLKTLRRPCRQGSQNLFPSPRIQQFYDPTTSS